ncbi:MAG: hypothetical protein JW745_08415 [Sedimentisphaerales bacterium]|nr:hypothetical protein [Sedimentisphaerales bacterium]MBN2842225.1 hypothetical protein [Sedimentisphaerales bacterium]
MGQRRDRLDGRMENQKITRKENSLKKDKETVRRREDIVKLINAGTFPYTPTVMSWLSMEMGKKSSQLTEAEVKEFLA